MAQQQTHEQPPLAIIVAANVRRFRKQLGLGQEKLAFAAGISREAVRQIERGRLSANRSRQVRLDTLEALARALKVTVVELVTFDPQAMAG